MEHRVGDRIEIINIDDDAMDSMVGRQGIIIYIGTAEPRLIYPFKVKMDFDRDDEDHYVFCESEFINLTQIYNNKLNQYIKD